MLKDMQEYAKTQNQTKGVFIPEPFLKNLPITTAALLAQIVYWHLASENGESKLRVKKINKETGEITYWIAKKRDDWKAECGITPREYDKAIKQLTDLGLVETKLFRFDGAVMTHVRLLEQNFLKVYNDWAQTQETSRFNEKCKIGEKNKTPGNPDFTKNVNSDKPSNDHDLTKSVKSDFTENVNSNLRKVLNQNLRKSEPLNREYITENTNKEYPYYIKGGTASLSESACPPAIINNTNDGIPGEIDTSNKEVLSLPKTNQDNAVSIDMTSPSKQDTMLLPNNNINNNPGINKQLQDTIIPAIQNIKAHMHNATNNIPGIQIEQRAVDSQNLPEGYMLLKDWLTKNCKIQWVIDQVLAQLDGNIICPPDKGHSKEWAAIMPQIANALPHVRDLLIHLGYAKEEIDSVISYVRRRNGTATRVIGYFAPESLYTKSEDSPLGVYVKADPWIKL